MDLDLVPEADLINALTARYDHFVCMGISVLDENAGTMRYLRRWAGHSITCAGMFSDMIEPGD